MITQFIDTNIFLTYLTTHDPVKTKACYALFKRAENSQVTLMTSESVIAEVVYVLSSKKHYSLSAEDIKKCLSPILLLRGLKLPYKKIFLRALEFFSSYHLDFEDCLTIAHIEHQKIIDIYSYDTDFDQIDGIKRIEP